MDIQSTQQKECPKTPPGAWQDQDNPIFGVDLIDGTSGAFVQPGYYMPEAWGIMLYDSMLEASKDKELESQDKNS